MKFKSKKIQNLIKLDSDFASIEGIDGSGRVIYDLAIYADIFSCLSNNAITIKVSAYKKSPTSKVPIFQKAMTSQALVTGLKTNFSRKKEKSKKAKSNPMAVTHVDISQVISNEIPSNFRSPMPRKKFEKLVGTRTVTTAVFTKNIYDSIDPLDLSIPTFVNSGQSPSVTPRQSAIKTVLRDGIDPASISDGDFPIISSFSAIQGLKHNNYAASSDPSKRGKKKSPGKKKKKTSDAHTSHALMSMASKTTKEKVNLMSHLGKKSTVGVGGNFSEKAKLVVTKMPATWERLDDELLIKRSKLKGVNIIYLLFEVIDNSGKIIDTFIREIDHETKMSEYLTPDQAPIVKVKKSIPGQNILMLSQRDEVATSIEVFRRVVNPDSVTMESPFKLIGTVEVTKNMGEVRLDDMVNNTRSCLYRAVAVGPRGQKCPEFHGAVSEPTPIYAVCSDTPKKVSIIDPTHISVFAETVDDEVNIRLTNIPEGPVSVYVIAYDLSVDKKKKNRRVVGASDNQNEDPLRRVGSQTTSLTFKDRDIKHNHIYEYGCVMIYPTGEEVTSVSCETHEFRKKTDKTNVILSLDKPDLRMDGSGVLSFSFNIGARFTETGIESILSAMEAGGIKGAYLKEINDNREKFSSLLSVLVIRQDSASGETETFGNHGIGNFMDDLATRTAAGVSEMMPGRSYRYVVQLLVRDAETLFDSSISKGTSVEKQETFKRKMSKFFNPQALQTGTLPSTAALSGYTSVKSKFLDDFNIGKTSVFQSVDVSVPRAEVKITNLTVMKSLEKNNIVQWDITGDASRIDHFLVIGGHQSVKAPLASIHHASSDGSYQFNDKKLSKLVGTTSYSVVPVLTSFDYGKETDTVSITRDSSEPSFTVSKVPVMGGHQREA